jgi:hypothetical protein
LAGIKNVRKYLTKNALRTVSDCGNGGKMHDSPPCAACFIPFLKAGAGFGHLVSGTVIPESVFGQVQVIVKNSTPGRRTFSLRNWNRLAAIFCANNGIDPDSGFCSNYAIDRDSGFLHKLWNGSGIRFYTEFGLHPVFGSGH